jgi:hypothetical protein
VLTETGGEPWCTVACSAREYVFETESRKRSPGRLFDSPDWQSVQIGTKINRLRDLHKIH